MRPSGSNAVVLRGFESCRSSCFGAFGATFFGFSSLGLGAAYEEAAPLSCEDLGYCWACPRIVLLFSNDIAFNKRWFLQAIPLVLLRCFAKAVFAKKNRSVGRSHAAELVLDCGAFQNRL